MQGRAASTALVPVKVLRLSTSSPSLSSPCSHAPSSSSPQVALDVVFHRGGEELDKEGSHYGRRSASQPFQLLHVHSNFPVSPPPPQVGLDVAFHGGEDESKEFDMEDSQYGGSGNSCFFFASPRPAPPPLQVGLDVAFHGGEDEGEEFDMEDSQYGGRRFLTGRSMHHRMPGVLEPIVRMLNPKRWGRPGGPAEAFGQKRDVWHRALDNTPYGQFSLAMYEANYVMEDTAEVEGSSSGVYIGVHDGHGGTETSEFLKENLYFNLKAQFMHQGGQVSAEAVRGAFHEAFTQLSVDHNLSFTSIREKFIEEHADTPDAVVEKRGGFRVKGKVTVTRSFGDLYLKSHEFNREPLFSRFRVPEPFHPPLLSCEPNIAVRVLSPHDSFVILASDGLFEFISNQEAVDIVASSPRKVRASAVQSGSSCGRVQCRWAVLSSSLPMGSLSSSTIRKLLISSPAAPGSLLVMDIVASSTREDIAQQLIRAVLRRAAERREIRYQDLLRMASGQQREYHDDITVVVFFFNHEARNKHAKSNNMTWNHVQGGLRDAARGRGKGCARGSSTTASQWWCSSSTMKHGISTPRATSPGTM
ncbi:unnamed protein product [Closterium sp. Yama58-4]|nr:unnamed protein product [Closterium sp. Yama58-4]